MSKKYTIITIVVFIAGIIVGNVMPSMTDTGQSARTIDTQKENIIYPEDVPIFSDDPNVQEKKITVTCNTGWITVNISWGGGITIVGSGGYINSSSSNCSWS